MQMGITGTNAGVAEQVTAAWPWLLPLSVSMAATCLLWMRLAAHRRWQQWERARREELEAYCTLEISLPLDGEPRKLTERAKRVCRLVVDRSVYARAALFLRDGEQRLVRVASCGMDDLTLEALDRWTGHILNEESAGTPYSNEQREEEARRSFRLALRTAGEFDESEPMGCETATAVPLRLHRGRLVGLLAVCASREENLPPSRMQEAVTGLELLGAKLARTLERAMLMERLIQVERLAGAGQLVLGVANDLAGSVRVISDRAELIAGTSTEARIREHAGVIQAEALRMREVVDTLQGAWKPRAETQLPASNT